MRQLHLRLRVSRPCSAGEDVEYEACAVHHPDAQAVLEVFLLRGAELVVAYGGVNLVLVNELANFSNLARPEIGARVRHLEVLCEPCQGVSSRRLGKEGEFVKIIVQLAHRRHGRAHCEEDDPLTLVGFSCNFYQSR